MGHNNVTEHLQQFSTMVTAGPRFFSEHAKNKPCFLFVCNDSFIHVNEDAILFHVIKIKLNILAEALMFAVCVLNKLTGQLSCDGARGMCVMHACSHHGSINPHGGRKYFG